MRYWLMKTEPEDFSIDDLAARPAQTEGWDGVRNYQARNFMRDEMELGDRVFLYHSNAHPAGIVGIMQVVRKAYPDRTAFDPKHPHFDPKSDPDSPRWLQVDVRLVEHFQDMVTLDQLRSQSALKDMRILQRGNRLSVTPVTEHEWLHINSML